MKQTVLVGIMALVLCLALPVMGQSPPGTSDSNATFGFAGLRYDNAVAISVGALFDNVELVPGLLDVDIGPLSSLWYTDIFSSTWTSTPKQIGNVSFELVLKDQILIERLTLGILFGPNFDQQQGGGNVTDYLAGAAGGLAALNVAKPRARAWGPWAYAKYKFGRDNYIEGWHAGGGFFLRI